MVFLLIRWPAFLSMLLESLRWFFTYSPSVADRPWTSSTKSEWGTVEAWSVLLLGLANEDRFAFMVEVVSSSSCGRWRCILNILTNKITMVVLTVSISRFWKAPTRQRLHDHFLVLLQGCFYRADPSLSGFRWRRGLTTNCRKFQTTRTIAILNYTTLLPLDSHWWINILICK